MADVRSADHALMREMNIALILECLRRAAPISRADLAHMTGLTKATVSSLVRELLDARFVREAGLDPGHNGRPPIKLVLNPDAGHIIGAEIGVDFITVILTNFSADVIWRQHERMAPANRASALSRAVVLVREASGRAGNNGRTILGLGVGVPGLVVVDSGTLLYSANQGWTSVPLRQVFEAAFNFPVYVDNDANMAALGESYFGAARGSDFVLYVSCGAGVGGGIVLNRRILGGVAGLAGEVGHMTIDPAGPLCSCGNRGCWEAFVSQRAVFARVQAAVAAGEPTSLVAATGGDLTNLSVPLLAEAAQAGDAVALRALHDTGRYLGIGLANLVNALNPQRVVLGGPLSQTYPFLWPAICQEVEQRALRWSREAAEFVVAAHHSDACAMGGIATVYHHVLSQPLATTRWPAVVPASAGPARARA